MAWLDWVSPEWEEAVDEEIRDHTLASLERLRKKYDHRFALLLEVLSHRDPIGLIDMGAPPDEYVPEVKRILARLSEAISPEGLQELMHGVFVEMFSAHTAGPKSQYAEPASVFWNQREGTGMQ